MSFNPFFKSSVVELKRIFTSHFKQPVHDLSKNESPFDFSREMKRDIVDTLIKESWNKYPSNHEGNIINVISNKLNVRPSNILLGSGSSNLISLLMDAFSHCEMIIPTPSFMLYGYYAQMRGITTKMWRLNSEYNYDLADLPVIKANSVLFICSPNNPTGNIISSHSLNLLIKQHPDCLIIIDEAYVEFSKRDLLHYAKKHPNVILLRTFSKALSLASIRLGYLVGNAEIIEYLYKLRNPFQINPFTSLVASQVLSDKNFARKTKQNIQTIIEERDAFFNYLNNVRFNRFLKAYPSEGNFIFFTLFNVETFEFLCSEFDLAGIAIQKFLDIMSLRVTIGSTENNLLVRNLINKALLKQIVV